MQYPYVPGRPPSSKAGHAFATNARELGVPLEDVQDAMGHAANRDPALRLAVLYDPAGPDA